MRSEEEFKAELFRRCNIYQKKQKDKRRRWLFVGTPLAACMAVLMVLFVPAIQRSDLVPNWNHSKPEPSDQSGFSSESPHKDGDLAESPPSSGSVPTDSNPLQAAFIDVTSLISDNITDPLETLHHTDPTTDASESLYHTDPPANVSETLRYTDPAKVEQILYYLDTLSPTRNPDHTEETQAIFRISVTYLDGSTQTYTQYETNKFYRDDGTWMVLNNTDAKAFQQLINELSSDSNKTVK